MRPLIVLSAAALLRVCASDAPEPGPPVVVAAPAPQVAAAVTVGTPPGAVETAPITVDAPPPVAPIGASAGVGVVGSAEVRMVQAGPREVRLYGLHHGRRLRAAELRVHRARIMTPQGPQVVVLEPREDYYVAVTPFDIPPSPRFDFEVALVSEPAPPSLVVVQGFAPRASVEVAAFVPGPPGVMVVAPPPPSVGFYAPGPPSVRVRGGVHVDARVRVPAPRVVVVPPRPPSISIGIGVPSPRVVVVGQERHGHHGGRGRGHDIGRGNGHRRHGH